MAQVIAGISLVALGLLGASFHEPFHTDGGQRPMAVTKSSDQDRTQRRRTLKTTWVRQDYVDQLVPCRI